MSSRPIMFASILAITLAGCINQAQPVVTDPTIAFNAEIDELGATLELQSELDNLFNSVIPAAFTYPIEYYTTARTKKVFGQYITPDSGDRFAGYHTGDDVEVTDVAAAVPVYALTTATVVQKQTVSGYGGVVILEFVDTNVTYHALYGHLNLDSVTAIVGDTVTGGMQLGVLGDDASAQTDGERKHLHFGLYPYIGTELYAGYVTDNADLVNWVNPADWLRSHNAI